MVLHPRWLTGDPGPLDTAAEIVSWYFTFGVAVPAEASGGINDSLLTADVWRIYAELLTSPLDPLVIVAETSFRSFTFGGF